MTEQQEGQTKFRIPLMMVIVGIAIIGLFGYSVWAEKNKENDAANENLESVNIDIDSNRGISSVPPQQMTEAERELGRQRDAQRLSDVKKIRTALDGYKAEKNEYPEDLSALIPKYIGVIPINPAPGGIEYSYTPIGSAPYTFYDMSYSLEVGAEGLEYGDHTASPDSIANP
ncbi:MAG: hypothetical protein WCT27_04980 [Patescibacteria group bacterium]|jgi:hypothetical protein